MKLVTGIVEEIAEEMRETRAATLAFFDLAREEDLHESPGFGFRPIIWHLAHIGVFEAYWLLQRVRSEGPPDERYERVFDPINTPREESRDLPSRREMEEYLARVRERVLDYLPGIEQDESDPLLRDGYVFRLVLEHEQQHQETLAYLFQLLSPSKKTRPVERMGPGDEELEVGPGGPKAVGEMVSVPAGPFLMGATGGGFAYDNELPARTVDLPDFRIDKFPVTNEEYLYFIQEGGYDRSEFWSGDGWTHREREKWNSPLYWAWKNGVWREQRMFEEGPMEMRLPVTGVSWYEAEAYAKFLKKRLPSEAEWEKAAGWDPGSKKKGRFSWGDETPTRALSNFNYHVWGTTPVGRFPGGASAYGCQDMTGNVWEWTSSSFTGYPGFKAFPYPEYSEAWFDGDHRVLKGGSWATRASLLRISFRNFFRRHFRIAFAGIRCAADA